MDWKVRVGDEEVSAVYEPAASSGSVVFVCAHGAGGNMSSRGMLSQAAALRERGIDIVRFNFLYSEKGSGRPDPMPRLESCVSAVVDHVRRALAPKTLLIGGRSMGGRAASMLAAKGFSADGLLLLAYPLHPPDKPHQLRDAHLPSITMPVLCFNGTKDTFCRRELMEQVLTRVGANWTMHWLESADHSFHVLKSSGRTDAEVLREIGEAAGRWIGTGNGGS